MGKSNLSTSRKKLLKIQLLLYWKATQPGVRSARIGIGMLGHCVNDKCGRPLHTLAEGRLFQFEVVSISLSASDEASAPFDEKPQREMVHFWLCGDCASAFTLVLEPARGLTLVSLEEHELRKGKYAPTSVDIVQAKRC
jgi:hypothetical protein